MKKITIIIAVMLMAKMAICQINVFDTSFYSVSLDETMPVRVYLPPGYDDHPEWYYPVIYVLPSWTGSIYELNGFVNLAQDYINEGVIDPVIMVSAFNTPAPFQGNMYVNSVIWGDYEDYNVNDVVEWVESAFRAMPYREYRAIQGQSMGAHGAFRYAILHKDKFKGLAAHAAIVTTDENLWLEPCRLQVIQEHSGLPPYMYNYSTDGVFTRGTFLLSAAWTPNPESSQTYINPQIVDYLWDEYAGFIDSIQQTWHEFDISYLLQQLSPEDSTGIFFGCGSDDDLLLYPPNVALKDTLEMLGLPYEFFNHTGGHTMPFSFKQRALIFLDSLLMPPDFHTGTRNLTNMMPSNDIDVYPNPARDIIHIKMKTHDPVTITMTGFLGQVAGVWSIENASDITLPVSHLNPGMYLVTITGKNFRASRKVIIR